MAEAVGTMGERSNQDHPSVLLTFLLADIRGYTRYSAEQGDHAAARLSERFLSLCREIVSAHGGEVFGSAGDQALAAFTSAHAALYAALALQSRLEHEQAAQPDLPFMAGIGLDTGEGIRIGHDYRGNAINLAARLCSLAGGGEIFASEAVITVARKVEGLTVVDRGEVTLKGLAHPVRVVQIAAQGLLPDSLPPLQPTLVTHPTNLPDEPTPFIGRSGNISAVVSLLQQPHTRLVTMTGPGGTGKTRLALQVGNTLLYNFRDGVVFVDLAPLTDPTLVSSAIADVLGVKEEGSTDLAATLATSLREKHLLLVLDNFEHLLDACTVVASLLDGCRELHVLVTSRIPLHVSREQEYPVTPLAVPDPAHLPTDLARLSQYESVALFIARARAVNPRFEVTNTNAPAVAEICVRLDGLPLAIELASARIKLLPPPALLQRLNQRLTLLTGGAKDRPTRQQTLRGTIDWSYSLLSEEEQGLFARLSVFAGGCTFEAAEAVCNPERTLEFIQEMGSLVDKSLLQQGGADEPRFYMLETIKEYAAEKLNEQQMAAQSRDAHAHYFLQLAERAEPALRSGRRNVWLQRLEQEHDNLRVAFQVSLAQGEVDRALRMAGALIRFWYFRGSLAEGRQRLATVLTMAGDEADRRLRGQALYGEGLLAFYQSDHSAVYSALDESIRLFAEVGDEVAGAYPLIHLGLVTEKLDVSLRRLEQSVSSFRRSEDAWGLALATFYLGAQTVLRSDHPADAIPILEESLTRFRGMDDSWGVSGALYYLGVSNQRRGDAAAARAYYDEALGLFRTQRDKWRIAVVLLTLARMDLAAQRFLDVPDRLREVVVLGREIGNDEHLVESLTTYAALAGAERDYHRMGVLWGASRAFAEERGLDADTTKFVGFDARVADATTEIGTSMWEAHLGEGRAMSLEEAIAYALEEDE